MVEKKDIGVIGSGSVILSLLLLTTFSFDSNPDIGTDIDSSKLFSCDALGLVMECTKMSLDSQTCNNRYVCEDGWVSHELKADEPITKEILKVDPKASLSLDIIPNAVEYVLYKTKDYGDYTLTLFSESQPIQNTFIGANDKGYKFGSNSQLADVRRYKYVIGGDVSGVYIPPNQEYQPLIKTPIGGGIYEQVMFDFADVCENVNISGSGLNSSCEVTRFDDRIEIEFWSDQLIDPALVRENVTDCRELNESNHYYILNASISNSASMQCINITADNVTFDLNGFTIDGTSTATSYGVYVTGRNATIANGTISEWTRSVAASEADYLTVRNTSLIGASGSTTTYGVIISTSDHVLVTNNTITQSNIQNVQYAINLGSTNSEYVEISYNTVTIKRAQFIITSGRPNYLRIHHNNFMGGGTGYYSDYGSIRVVPPSGSVVDSRIYKNNFTNIITTAIDAGFISFERMSGGYIADNYFQGTVLSGDRLAFVKPGSSNSAYIRLENNTFEVSGAGSYEPIRMYTSPIIRNNTFTVTSSQGTTGGKGCGNFACIISDTPYTVNGLVEFNTFNMNGYTCVLYTANDETTTFRNNTIVGTTRGAGFADDYVNMVAYHNNFSSLSAAPTTYYWNTDLSPKLNTSVLGVAQGNIYRKQDLMKARLLDTDSDGWIDSGDDYPFSYSMSGLAADYGPYDNRDDTTPPIVTWDTGTFIEINSSIESPSVTVAVTTDEWAWCNVSVGGTRYAMTPDAEQDAHTYEATLNEGNISINVTCIDGAYNSGDSTVAWVNYASASLFLDWNWTAINSSIGLDNTYICVNLSRNESRCNLSFNGSVTEAPENGSNVCWNKTSIASGNYSTIFANCSNGANTANSTIAWLYVDVTAPTLSWDWGYINSSDSIDVTNVTINSDSEVIACNLEINGTNYTMVSNTTTEYYYEWSVPVGVHNYTLEVECNDTFNNTGSSSTGWYRSLDVCIAHDSPGESVTMTEDISIGESCMTISGNSVSIDCAGHSITGAGTGIGIDITSASDVTIENCVLRNFSIGVKGTSAPSLTMSNTSVFDAVSSGIILDSSDDSILETITIDDPVCGINITDSDDVSVTDSDSNNNTYGICVFDSLRVEVSSNTLINNSLAGILLNNTNDSIVANNTIVSNDSTVALGIIWTYETYGNNVTDNSIELNASSYVYGIALEFSAASDDLDISHNSIVLASQGTLYGVHVSSSIDDSYIDYNNITLTGGSVDSVGITVTGTSDSLSMDHNRIAISGEANSTAMSVVIGNDSTISHNVLSIDTDWEVYGIKYYGNNQSYRNRVEYNDITFDLNASQGGISVLLNSTGNQFVFADNTISSSNSEGAITGILVDIGAGSVISDLKFNNNTISENSSSNTILMQFAPSSVLNWPDVYSLDNVEINNNDLTSNSTTSNSAGLVLVNAYMSDFDIIGNTMSSYGHSGAYGIYSTAVFTIDIQRSYFNVSSNEIYASCDNAAAYGINIVANHSEVSGNTIIAESQTNTANPLYVVAIGDMEIRDNSINGSGSVFVGAYVYDMVDALIELSGFDINGSATGATVHGVLIEVAAGITLDPNSYLTSSDFNITNTVGSASAVEVTGAGSYDGFSITRSSSYVFGNSDALSFIVDASDVTSSCDNLIFDSLTSFSNSTGGYSVGIVINGEGTAALTNASITDINVTAITSYGITKPPTAGIALLNSSNAVIQRVNVTTSATLGAATGIYLGYDSSNVMLENITAMTDYGLYLNNTCVNVTCLNCTYSQENVDAGSSMYRLWFVRIRARDSLSSTYLSLANATAYNASQVKQDSKITGGDGRTSWMELIQYFNESGSTTYWTPYNLTVTRLGYIGYEGLHSFSDNHEFVLNLTSSAKDWTPQGNLNLRGYFIIKEVATISMISPDGTVWSCTVNDLGTFSCAS